MTGASALTGVMLQATIAGNMSYLGIAGDQSIIVNRLFEAAEHDDAAQFQFLLNGHVKLDDRGFIRRFGLSDLRRLQQCKDTAPGVIGDNRVTRYFGCRSRLLPKSTTVTFYFDKLKVEKVVFKASSKRDVH